MNLLNDLIEKMVDEAPVEFTETQLRYVSELAKTYAYRCSKATLKEASDKAKLDYEYSIKHGKFMPDGIDKESITNESNIKLL